MPYVIALEDDQRKQLIDLAQVLEDYWEGYECDGGPEGCMVCELSYFCERDWSINRMVNLLRSVSCMDGN